MIGFEKCNRYLRCHEFQQIRPLPLEKSLFYNLRSTNDGFYKKYI